MERVDAKNITQAYEELEDAEKFCKDINIKNEDVRSCLDSAKKLLDKAEVQRQIYLEAEKSGAGEYEDYALGMFVNYAELAMFDTCLITECDKRKDLPNYKGNATYYQRAADRNFAAPLGKYDLDYLTDGSYEFVAYTWALLKGYDVEHFMSYDGDIDDVYHAIDTDYPERIVISWVKNIFGHTDVSGIEGIAHPYLI